jgi:hypothetical protein
LRLRRWIAAGLFFVLSLASMAQEFKPLAYAPAPIDNPLKGFVPYDTDHGAANFPHSMECFYFPLAGLMNEPGRFNWEPIEKHLAGIASRGHQAVFRIYLDYPGTPVGTPRFLIDDGLKTRAYEEFSNAGRSVSPDYEDPRLRKALKEFIAAFGARYDGDPRIGFITVGLLGHWGEWHSYPHTDWFASKAVQREVMDAYLHAFHRTRLLLRYPAGPADKLYAENASLPFGYHDDSFAWATRADGLRKDSWFFLDRMARAGALEKWRMQPIGGEVRPEVWYTLWDEPSGAPKGQEYDRCVEATHATWLMNSGVFHRLLEGSKRERALAGARRLGYELTVDSTAIDVQPNGSLWVGVRLRNLGVAPFYYDWPVELGLLDERGSFAAVWRTDWALHRVLPDSSSFEFDWTQPKPAVPAGDYRVLMRVANPLPSASPLRFANKAQDEAEPGWLTLGRIRL